ncbi:hypothetical protein ABEB36_004318 [Hypothenemus hampei]|uniref:Uncharacterized protein n=1 Tax=Hypothenemus hampei TaxID=57062 RepID=A0ABD1F634_HYPHA
MGKINVFGYLQYSYGITVLWHAQKNDPGNLPLLAIYPGVGCALPYGNLSGNLMRNSLNFQLVWAHHLFNHCEQPQSVSMELIDFDFFSNTIFNTLNK